MQTILAAVDDLFFLGKIQQTAKLLGIRVGAADPRKLREEIARTPVCAVLLDLNHRSGAAVEALRTLKSDPATAGVPVLGFLSHVQTDLAAAARSAGCDIVLARSAFSQQLPQLLEKLFHSPKSRVES
ncbi:MAG: response regulator [Terriglobia bacterium]